MSEILKGLVSRPELLYLLKDIIKQMPNEIKKDELILTYAVGYKNDNPSPDIVQLLIDSGVKIKNICFIRAVGYHNNNPSQEIVKIIINTGINVNMITTSRSNPLIFACGYQNKNPSKEIIKILIDAGVNVNHRNKYGRTAYDYNNNPTIKDLLIFNGADISNKQIITLPLKVSCARTIRQNKIPLLDHQYLFDIIEHNFIYHNI